jgi:glycosyltransferase involved in cell wall biosynthesis
VVEGKTPRAFRVLVSSYACQPGEGSEAGIGWNWVFALAKAGVSVWVLTLPKGKDAIEKVLSENPNLDLHFVYIEHPAFGRFLRNLRGGHSWNHLPAYFEWQDKAYKVAKNLFQEVDFDVVHHISMSSLHVGSRLWRLDRPFIFGPVGGGQTAPAGFREHLRGGWLFEYIRTIVARHLYGYILNARSTVRGSALVLVANRETEMAVRHIGAREVRSMTDIGFATDRVSARSPVSRCKDEPLRILWIAKLNPRKGLLLALEAVSLIESDTAWKLTIIGDGPQAHMLPRWLKRLTLEGKVEWRGRIPWANVQTAYDDADLFLFTSLRDTTGIQLLEAMGRGVPILTLDHQGAATVVPFSAGIRVPVSTPKQTAEQLARAIERLAADRALLSKMGEAAIEVARSHGWDRKALEAIAIYEELTESECP